MKKITYVDKQALAANQHLDERDYWLTKLAGDPEKSFFPYDYKNGILRKDAFKEARLCLNGDLCHKILGLCKGLDHTLHMVLVAAVAALLSKYTGSDDIIVGSPIYRQNSNIEFINTLLLIRNRVYLDATFKELLIQVRKTIREAVKNQNYPFEILLKQLNIKESESRFPLFDVAVLLDNIQEIKYIQQAHPNIILYFLRTDKEIQGILHYNHHLYNSASINRIIRHLLNLIAAVILNLDTPLSRIEIMSDQEKRQILEAFNNTERDYPREKALDELIDDQVKQIPDRISVAYKEESVSYKELQARSIQLSTFLLPTVKREEPVGLMAENSLAVIIAILGILKAGGAYVPLNSNFPLHRKRFLLSDCNIRVLLTTFTEGVDDLSTIVDVINLCDPKIYRNRGNRKGSNRYSNLAYIMYTSGSTGIPKGVMVEHRSVVRLVKNTNYVDFRNGGHILMTGALEFDASTFEIWGTLLNGLRLYLSDKMTVLSPEILKEVIQKCDISTMWMTSPLFNRMLDADIEIFCGLRNLLVGGDVLSPNHINRLRARFPHLRVINGYGPTENTTFSTTYLIEKEYRESIPIGAPIANSTAYIFDRSERLQPIGIAGELWLGGDGVARGYANNPELTADKFTRHPLVGSKKLYKTGDLTKWLPDGRVEFLGRIDYQVKIRGNRIELGEIESRLLRHPKIKEAVAVSREDENGDKILIAYFTTAVDGDRRPDNRLISELRDYLSHFLPDHMIPNYIIALEKIPLTPHGKIDRRALPDPEIDSSEDYIAPTNEIEYTLAAIWSELLLKERDAISIKANFFEMGGHSLKASVLTAKVHKELDVRVPLVEVFRNPTIKDLSGYIQTALKEKFSSIDAAEKKEYYLLSSAQKRLYVIQQMDLESTVYNMPQSIYLGNEPDVGKLEETFRRLIDRHESLRSSFHAISDEPVQQIWEEVDFRIECYRIDDKLEEVDDPSSLDAELLKMTSRLFRPFELTQAPLMRVSLIDAGRRGSILMVDMHHIICDGISMGLLLKDFTDQYEGRELPGLRLQYKDFAVWQNSIRRKEIFTRQENFWLKQFSGDIPVPDSLYDFPRPAVRSFEGSGIEFELPAELVDQLSRLALQQGATTFMVLLAVFNVLLSRIGGEEDIVIGTPAAGRRHADLESVIGMFVNTVALRNFPAGQKRFDGFLRELKERTLSAFENQDYPFEELVEKVIDTRDTSRNPIFDVMFVLQTQVEGARALPPNEITWAAKFSHHLEQKVSKFDLTFNGEVQDSRILFSVRYCTKLFREQTILRFVNYFRNLLTSTLQSPESTLSKLEMIPEEEKLQVLFRFNDTGKDYPRRKTIPQLFHEEVQKFPEGVVIEGTGCQQLTYRMLDIESARLASRLRERGVAFDHIVGIIAEQSLNMVLGIMGILKAGGAYLPIDPQYPEDRLTFILEDSSVEFLLRCGNRKETNTYPDIWESVHVTYIEALLVNDSQNEYDRECSREKELFNPNPGNGASTDLAYVIYTSGTTGIPKGVLISHTSAVNTLFFRKKEYRLNSTDIVVQLFSFTFDGFVTSFFTPIICGSRVVLLGDNEIRDAVLLKNAIKKYSVTHFICVPALYRSIIDNLQKGETPSLRAITLAGDHISPLIPSLTREKVPALELVNEYGITEAAVMSTIRRHQERDDHINIGRPIANCRIYILDRYEKTQAVGISGQLCIGGSGPARGYLNNPDLTAEKFIRWQVPDVKSPSKTNGCPADLILYHTGDLARWLPGGNIQLLGRIDHQVKVRGFRIELGEIENRLLRHDKVKDAVVSVADDTGGDKHLYAYVVHAGSVKDGELKDYLSTYLPPYMVPRFFIELDKIPLTTVGKVDHKALPAMELKNSQTYIPPEDSREERLVEIWAGILNLEKAAISVTADFFELGGHSLKANTLITRIHREFNIRIPLVEIFKAPTIRELANYLDNTEKIKFTAIEPVEKREFYDLSSAQKRLYLLQQVDPESTAYNMAQVFPLEQVADPELEKLPETFGKLIKRHESLRTSIQMVDAEPRQKIRNRVDFEIEYYNSDTGNETIQTFIRPFNLYRAPLLRVGLLKTKPGIRLLLLDMHHIISDGISHQILIRDFVSFHNKFELPLLRIQYKDYAQWQNRLLEKTDGGITTQEKFWLKEFDDDIPVLQLPTDFDRPVIQSFEGNTYRFRLSGQKIMDLKETAQRERVTLFMLLLAIYKVFLAKICRQEDIVVGTPIAGRRHSDLEQLVGLFVNTIALRSFPIGSKPFVSLLEEIKQKVLGGFENQDYPFEYLVEKVAIRRDAGRNPLFDTMFTFHSFEDSPKRDHPGRIERESAAVEYDFAVSKFDLTLTATETDEGVDFSFQYSTRLFKEETISKFSRYFERVLSSILRSDSQSIATLEIITDEEKDKILHKFNKYDSTDPANNTIHCLFEDQVKKTPCRVAISGDSVGSGNDVTMTYRELDRRADRLAGILRAYGVQPGAVIAIMVERSINMVETILAIFKAGGSYLPLDYDYPEERKGYILADSSADILIKGNMIYAGKGLRDLNGIFELDNVDGGVEDLLARPLRQARSAPAYIIYTSGSTGRPKGVIIEHGSVINLLQVVNNAYPLEAGDNYLLKTPLLFDVSVCELFGWFPGGGRLTILPEKGEKDPWKILDKIQRHAITHVNFVPSLFNIFVNLLTPRNKFKLFSLKYIFLAGEALFPEPVVSFFQLYTGIRLVNLYGPTETTVYASQFLIADWHGNKTIPIGTPLSNTQLYILDHHGNLQVVGIPGELCIGGSGLSRGYLNNPQLTAEKFFKPTIAEIERLYRSGDLARWMPDGNIEFLGRIDRQVKIRGYRLELGEIEKVLTSHGPVKEAVAAVREEEIGDQKQAYLCAYFISSKNVDVTQLKEYLGMRLPHYMIPSRFLRLERLPLLPSGKIDLRALPDLSTKPAGQRTAPENRAEEKMVDIWSDLLKIKKEKIGTGTNFFELGGNSLTASILAFKVQKEFQVPLPLGEVFKNGTIKHLSTYITAGGKENRLNPDENVVLLRRGTAENLHLFFIHAGSGEVEGYIELCNRLNPGPSYWGIKAESLIDYAPRNISIRQAAQKYVRKIKSVQPAGPYRISGWCIGGTIAFEMVGLLEEMKEEVAFFSMINSFAPSAHLKRRQTKFSLRSESDRVGEYLKDKKLKELVRGAKEMGDIWKAVVNYLEETGFDVDVIKKFIPPHTQRAIPDFERSKIGPLIYYLNMIKTFERARNMFIPGQKIRTAVNFFEADGAEIINKEDWGQYCVHKINYYKIEGDHFSIFQPPEVDDFASIFKLAMSRSHD